MENFCCDFHTHRPSGKHPELISGSDPAAGKYTSLEYHPWYLPAQYSPLPDELKQQLAAFTALGEIGLDRLRGPQLSVQMEYFTALCQLAADCRKPVVIHAVKAFPEIFSILKRFDLRWMFHGFRGSVTMLENIWSRGGTVSFHPEVCRYPALLAKLRSPTGKFGFESDDSEALTEDICAKAAAASGNADLQQLANRNFMEFVNGK